MQVYLSPYYAAEVAAAAKNITDATIAAKALKVAKIPTFIWLDVRAKVPDLATYLAAAAAQQTSTGQKVLVEIIVYDLPNRCERDPYLLGYNLSADMIAVLSPPL